MKITLEAIRTTRDRLRTWLDETPVNRWRGAEHGPGEVWAKLELWQRTGTFKPRGALSVMLRADPARLARGVTAVSAGNHAIATAYAAHVLGVGAKVVMIESASPVRVAACRRWGAEVVLAPDVHRAFERVREIERAEGRLFVHPFEGEATALGTATVGLELIEQLPELDLVIVPVGGGGLAAGLATAIKLAKPACRVYGVEPEGADTMHRSFDAGSPQAIEQVRTIADSLGAPSAEPYSFGLCRAHLDGLVRVSDDELRESMRRIFDELKLAVEPACAASTAALAGPLEDVAAGRRVGLIFCGSNIDAARFAALTARGEPAGAAA
jgi:threonine dehydratase